MEGLPDIVLQTPLWLALLTTGVGAIEGALLSRKGGDVSVDIMGAAVFALLLGLGGGFARDSMLGNTPFVALRTPWYLLTVLGALVLALVVGRWIPQQGRIMLTLDALTLGLYAAIGTQYAMDFHVSWVGALLVGCAASVTGGVVVSVLRRETPSLLAPGFPYAILAIVGSATYLVLAPINGAVASFGAVALVVGLRWLTVGLDIRTPALKAFGDGNV
jgi:uncharacterized membrane protein YeiH